MWSIPTLEYQATSRYQTSPFKLQTIFPSYQAFTMAYTDRPEHTKSDPVSVSQLTENDIEKSGLTVGRRTKTSALKAYVSRQGVCITALFNIACLVLLFFSFTSTPRVHFANKEVAKQSQERIKSACTMDMRDTYEYTWSLYGDSNTSSDTYSTAGMYTSNCNLIPTDITQIVWGPVDPTPPPYTVIFYPDANCFDFELTKLFTPEFDVWMDVPPSPNGTYYKAHVC